MPATSIATSDALAKKIPLLDFLASSRQHGFVAAMHASRAWVATQCS
jgi:hypothetical protein